MNEKSSLEEYADKAKKILEKSTPFSRNRKLIATQFKGERFEKDEIIIQLTLIDSFYSTSMSKRFDGIEDIAEKISKIENLKEKFEKYAQNPIEETIGNLFKGKYGYNKSGEDAGSAVSLISKYAYFLTDYKFPIYDSLVVETINYNFDIFGIDKKLKKYKYTVEEFVNLLNNVREKSHINEYEKLDNLLWLIGKLKKESYSLILTREEYKIYSTNKQLSQELMELIEITKKFKSKFDEK